METPSVPVGGDFVRAFGGFSARVLSFGRGLVPGRFLLRLAMAAALARLRDEPAFAKACAANARQRLDEMLSEEAVCRDYMRVFAGELP